MLMYISRDTRLSRFRSSEDQFEDSRAPKILNSTRFPLKTVKPYFSGYSLATVMIIQKKKKKKPEKQSCCRLETIFLS